MIDLMTLPNYLLKSRNTLLTLSLACLVLLLVACTESGSTEPGNDTSPTALKVQLTPLNDTGVDFALELEPALTLAQAAVNPNETDPEKIIIKDPNKSFNSLPEAPGQDREFGRDVAQNNPDNGRLGFDFTKLDTNRSPLPATENDPMIWHCTRDNVTGLVWEHKHTASITDDDRSDHLNSNRYTWYEPDSSKNGGVAGQQDGGGCKQFDLRIKGDTDQFIRKVNAKKLCGYDNWRLPMIEEMRSLIDYSNPTALKVDDVYFPHIGNIAHRWTWQTDVYSPDKALGFHFHDGWAQSHAKSCNTEGESQAYHNGVVLVRSDNIQ